MVIVEMSSVKTGEMINRIRSNGLFRLLYSLLFIGFVLHKKRIVVNYASRVYSGTIIPI